MSDIVSMFEKKIDKMVDKMFGDKDTELKAITKLTLMNKDLNDPDVKCILEQLRQDKIREQEMLLDEMSMTLDASGNVVPLVSKKVDELTNNELSPRQQDIKVIYHDN